MFKASFADRRQDRSRAVHRCILFGLVGFAPTMTLAATQPSVAASTPSQSTACGDAHMTRQTTDRTVVRRTSGAGETVSIVTRGPGGEITLEQRGPCNDADIRQGGSDNKAVVRQQGTGNRVVVRQGAPEGEGQ